MTDKLLAQHSEPTSGDLMEVFWRRKYIILLAVLVTLAATYVTSVYFMTSIYRGKTTVQVREEKLNPNDAFPSYEAGNQYIYSQAEIFKSDRVVKTAIAQIIADNQNNTAAIKLNRLVDESYIHKGLDEITVGVIAGTNILELHVDHEDPYVAAALANAMTSAYIEDRISTKTRVIDDVIASRRLEMEQTVRGMRQAEKEFLSYVETENVVLLQGSDIVLNLNRYASLEEALITLDADIEKGQTQLEEMKKSLTNPSQATMPVLLNSQLIRDLKILIRAAETKRDELLGNFTPDHPAVVSIQGEISRLGSELENERNRILVSEFKALEVELKSLQRKKEIMAAEHKLQADRLQQVLKKQPQLEQLRYAIDSKRFIYRDQMLSLQNMEIVKARSIQKVDAEVLSTADVPERPVKPNVAKNMVFGTMLGFTLGCAIVLMTTGAAKQKPSAVPEERSEENERRQTSERRSAPRSEAFYEVSYSKLGEPKTCRSSDISTSGMRIVTEEALNKGTLLDFQINRPDMRPIAGKGSVAWSSPAQVNGKQGFFVAGIKFGEPHKDVA